MTEERIQQLQELSLQYFHSQGLLPMNPSVSFILWYHVVHFGIWVYDRPLLNMSGKEDEEIASEYFYLVSTLQKFRKPSLFDAE